MHVNEESRTPWIEHPLEDIGELTSSKRIFESDYVQSGIPFYRGKEISLLMDGRKIEDPYFISESRFNEIGRRFGTPSKDDILITAVGTLGNIYLVSNDKPFYFKDGNLIWLRAIRMAFPRFLAYQLRYLHDEILNGAIGSSQKALTIVSLKGLPIPLPSIEEQQAIAEALSDVDALINSLDALITKKRHIKQGTMQQLLTGNKRLPGFAKSDQLEKSDVGVIPADWSVKPLGSEIEHLEAGVSVNSVDKENGDTTFGSYILKTSAVEDGNFLPHECKRITSRDTARAKLNPRAETILISRMNTIALVGECGYVDRDYPNLFIPDRLWMTRFRSDNRISARWLSYVLTSNEYRKKLKMIATGTSGSMKNISQSSLLSLPFAFPELDEQSAIALVLSEMDIEIAALEQKRDKTKLIKQGMMQELLTGKTRLV